MELLLGQEVAFVKGDRVIKAEIHSFIGDKVECVVRTESTTWWGKKEIHKEFHHLTREDISIVKHIDTHDLDILSDLDEQILKKREEIADLDKNWKRKVEDYRRQLFDETNGVTSNLDLKKAALRNIERKIKEVQDTITGDEYNIKIVQHLQNITKTHSIDINKGKWRHNGKQWAIKSTLLKDRSAPEIKVKCDTLIEALELVSQEITRQRVGSNGYNQH